MHWQGRVDIGSKEEGPALQVVHADGELEVVDVEIKATKDGADFRVQHGAIGESLEVFGGDIPTVLRIGAANVRDTLRLQFLLNTGLTNDENLVLTLGKL